MKKTLVIHPKDHTTTFLADIYSDKKDWTILNEEHLNINYSKEQLREAIAQHDRIVMLGHGCSLGLFNANCDLVINHTYADQLKEKENLCIWCMSDLFVEEYGLKGFYTGMIISEVSEANLYKIDYTGNEIEESNRMLADAVRRYADSPKMLSKVQENYTLNGNKIIDYNRRHLYATAGR